MGIVDPIDIDRAGSVDMKAVPLAGQGAAFVLTFADVA
jgi:hypothetical protein